MNDSTFSSLDKLILSSMILGSIFGGLIGGISYRKAPVEITSAERYNLGKNMNNFSYWPRICEGSFIGLYVGSALTVGYRIIQQKKQEKELRRNNND